MILSPRRFTALAVLSLAVVPSLFAQADLRLVDQVVLSEDSVNYLARPTAVTADSDGYLVTDSQLRSVFRFDRSGNFVQRYGRQGDGPGEFQGIADVLAVDEEILVISFDPPAAQFFGRSSGELVRSYRLKPPIESAVVDGESLWTTGLDYETWTVLRHTSRSGGEAESMFPIPDGFAAGGPLGGIFHEISVEKWGDTLMVALEAMNELYVITETGEPVDTISVPVRIRRGIPDDPAEAITDALKRGPYAEAFAVLSGLRRIHRRADGSVLLVHYDLRPQGPPASADIYVTVISADRSQACVDAPIPLEGDVLPAIGFDGDQVLVLEQVIGSTLEARPVLRVFEVDSVDCDWVHIR